ncbi:MAG TPA: hypothetical protein VLK53_02155 [Gaiellaceae bacterium]|nr:hypothetical protein [Gaiellaceae bacterium]
MSNPTFLVWFRRLLVLGSVVAVGAALTSAASGSSGNTPAAAAPDVFERYAAAHPYGRGTVTPPTGTSLIVDDWFRDPTPIVTPAGERIVDDSFRDPTPIVTPAGERIVDDSFRDAAKVAAVSPTSGNSLDWADFGIGAGAMLGLAVLVAGLGLGALSLRQRSGRLGTS